jgi:OOP family OmpA-OmpF porin
MSKRLTGLLAWSVCATMANAASAQDASGSAGVSASTSTKEGASADASADASAKPPPAAKSAAAADPPYEPYEPGYPPEYSLLEIGIFGGVLFPAADHNLRYELWPHYELKTAPEIGARLGYYPASWLGLEGEVMGAMSKVEGTNGASAMYGARGHIVLQAATGYISPFLVVGLGGLGATSHRMGNDIDPAFHFGIGAKIPMTHLLSLRLDLRDNMTAHQNHEDQVHSFEFALGLSAVIERERKPVPPPPPDTDHDGFLDRDDKCPSEVGVAPSGCPADTDNDGVIDPDDYCPREAGPAPKGCPIVDPDPDKDGVPIPCDLCPSEAGVKPDGCPIKDKDGDGVFDDKDKCIDEPETKNGFEDADGCPDKIPDAIKKFSGVIEGIQFDKAKATIRKQSTNILSNAAKVLNQYPSIGMEISGHTSSEGDPGVNQTLSQDRADAVKQWLVDNGGVAPDRLKSRGAGSSEPRAEEKNEAGRAKNRRIEFKVLQ